MKRLYFIDKELIKKTMKIFNLETRKDKDNLAKMLE